MDSYRHRVCAGDPCNFVLFGHARLSIFTLQLFPKGACKKHIENRNLYVDYSDIQVVVVFLKENGYWSHEHINPIFLEFETPVFDGDDKKTVAYADAFNIFSEYWLNYSEDNGGSKELEMKAIEAAKHYRNICIEVEKESDSDFPEDMDDIEKIMC